MLFAIPGDCNIKLNEGRIMMKSKKTLIRILAVFLALCFFPVTAALAAHYDLTELNIGDQIFEGDIISDEAEFTVKYFEYDDYSAIVLSEITVPSASHIVLGAADANATDPGGDQKFAGWIVSEVTLGTPNIIELCTYWEQAYRVTYHPNGGTGIIPVDSNLYLPGEAVPLNDGSGLSWPGRTFLGWATNPGATAADVLTTYTMDPDASTLYAVWASTYTVTYDGNDSDGGSVPIDSNNYISGAEVTVLGNTGSLTKSGYTFSGWSDGTNTYTAGDKFIMGTDDVTLHAVWSSGGGGSTEIPTYTLTYDGNGATSGAAPVTRLYLIGSTAVISGNTGSLARSGCKFSGWNTKPDGSGTGYTEGDLLTMRNGNVVLYAQWESIKIVYGKDKWGHYNNYNVAYSTSDGKNTIVPTSYYYEPANSVLYKTPIAGTYDAKYSFVGFDDITDSYWASEFIWFLSARVIVNGIGNGLYDPEGTITRAQFIKMLLMIPGKEASPDE